MDVNELVSPSSFWTPRLLERSSPWAEHIPFAFWLVEAARPRIFVQLGTRPRHAYFAFCQAVSDLKLATRCVAVDTRRDNPAFMAISEQVDRCVFDKANSEYSGFSRLLTAGLDESLDTFTDGTVDILHFHFHGQADPAELGNRFDRWLPKMSDRGLILIDGIAPGNAETRTAAVFPDLNSRYPSFTFPHGCGLALIAVGGCIPDKLAALLRSGPDDSIRVQMRRVLCATG